MRKPTNTELNAWHAARRNRTFEENRAADKGANASWKNFGYELVHTDGEETDVGGFPIVGDITVDVRIDGRTERWVVGSWGPTTRENYVHPPHLYDLYRCPSCRNIVPSAWLDLSGCQSPGCTY